MPGYVWKDKKSQKEVEVIRAFSDYEKPPTEEEAPGLEDPEWERQIGAGQKLMRGPNWQGMKGHWLALFCILGASLLGPGCATTCGTKTIIHVGGCDANGRCGVLYMDGTSGNKYYPVPGQSVEVCR